MAVFFGTGNLPEFKQAVITIGAFDGVHHGHHSILRSVHDMALQSGGESIVISFDPHPRKLLYPEQSLNLLTSLDDKIRLINQAGIDHIVIVPFTGEFSRMSATSYVEDFLVRHFKPHTIVLGYDHHFGHDRKGNIRLLEQLAPDYGFKLVEIPAQWIEEAAVSSSMIRKCLMEGNVQRASRLLERYYKIEGSVIHGDKIGRTIGYPTANISLLSPDQLIPAEGVYAVYAYHNDQAYPAMASIGKRPTVSDSSPLAIEVHLFDFSEDLYGSVIAIYFVEYIREQVKLSSLEALQNLIREDEKSSRRILESAPPSPAMIS